MKPIQWRSLLGAGLMILLDGCAGERPDRLGVVDGRLAPCPGSPNCVSSFDANPRRRIAPLPYSVPAERLIARIKTILQNMPGAKIIAEKDGYLRAEFTSRIMRFVDDAEFYADGTTSTLHFRSASRVGYYDFGVNRRRIEKIRAMLRKNLRP